MNNRQAIRIAIESMTRDRKKYMFDANLFRRKLATGSVFENADEIVSKIDGAIEALQQMEADLKTLSKAAAYLKSKDNNECTCRIPGIDANNPAYCPTCGKHHRTIEWQR